jgi:hypothetical protein
LRHAVIFLHTAHRSIIVAIAMRGRSWRCATCA